MGEQKDLRDRVVEKLTDLILPAIQQAIAEVRAAPEGQLEEQRDWEIANDAARDLVLLLARHSLLDEIRELANSEEGD